MKIVVDQIDCFERPFNLRLPFRYGIVTLEKAIQAFVRIRVSNAAGRYQTGWSAEVMAPKWFDKTPHLSDQANEQQLRESIRIAASTYVKGDPLTPFALHASRYRTIVDNARQIGLNPLVASYGQALLDRAILDACCQVKGINFFDAINTNLPDIKPSALTTDFSHFDMDRHLSTLVPRAQLWLRHTIGMADALDDTDLIGRTVPDDRLPVSLEQVISVHKPRYFKIKLSGDALFDRDRLNRIAKALGSASQHSRFSLDGNEQYESFDEFHEAFLQFRDDPSIASFISRCLFIEQPVKRENTFCRTTRIPATLPPVIIDEADSGPDSFVEALQLGYRGVSSKQCKGIYRSLINHARVRIHGPHFLITAEDLTTQAGINVQQDLALAALLGIEHIEKNGHFYVKGMAGTGADEQRRFLQAHPTLYQEINQTTHLRISDGKIDLRDLSGHGFATQTYPDFKQSTPVLHVN